MVINAYTDAKSVFSLGYRIADDKQTNINPKVFLSLVFYMLSLIYTEALSNNYSFFIPYALFASWSTVTKNALTTIARKGLSSMVREYRPRMLLWASRCQVLFADGLG
jgi:hypothetical protein